MCLSAPTQDFEQNRLVYGLYLLRMSQKLKNISLYIPHERERTSGSREKQTFHIFWALLKLPFKSTWRPFHDDDYYHSTSKLQSGDRTSLCICLLVVVTALKMSK